VGCRADVVAWIDGGAWCEVHAIRVLLGHRVLPEREDQVSAARARRLGVRSTLLRRFAVFSK
jgi:hypothetical protein